MSSSVFMERGNATIAEAFVQYNTERGSRGLREGMESDDLLCSRNARSRGLPSLDARSGRPIQAALLEEIRASMEGQLEWSFDAQSEGQTNHFPERGSTKTGQKIVLDMQRSTWTGPALKK